MTDPTNAYRLSDRCAAAEVAAGERLVDDRDQLAAVCLIGSEVTTLGQAKGVTSRSSRHASAVASWLGRQREHNQAAGLTGSVLA
jgi:hypothetical protein